MKYQVNDWVNGIKVFETESEAQAALPTAQTSFLEREDYRFCWAIVEVNGEHTNWRNPVDSDPEEANYKVFNQDTGQYESFGSRSMAEIRRQELKANFLVSAKLDKVYEYVPPEIPKNSIPVEVL